MISSWAPRIVWAAIAITASPASLTGSFDPSVERQTAAAEGFLRIRQFSVGQGDASLITTPEGRRILIDAGARTDHVAEILREEGIDTVDLVIASHNHADHIGGMPGVLDCCVVRAYLENGVPHKSQIYIRTMQAVEMEPGLQYLKATDRTLTLGSLKLRILAPPRQSTSQNNSSVGVLMQFGQFDALFTGDSERRELSEWLATAKVPRVEMLKAAHHGAWDGVTKEWAAATSPEIVVISVSATNGYGHPDRRTEQLWAAAGARIFRTDRHGMIEVMARHDGTFTVQTHVGAAAVR